MAERRKRIVGRIGRAIAIVAGLAAVALIGAVGGAWWLRTTVADANRAIGRIVDPGGVQEAGYVTIGGVRQWITVRGQDRRAPILLFLHGGPGDAVSDVAYSFQRPWEDYFTVVQWDQRGAGRSGIDRDKIRGTLTKEQLIADTIELIEQLRRRFHQPRIVLAGQSWGTLLVLEVAHRRPDLLYAGLTMGQQTSWKAAYFEESRQLLMREAAARGDTTRLARLRAIGPPTAFRDGAAFDAWGHSFLGDTNATGHSWHNAVGARDWSDRAIALALVSPTFAPKMLWAGDGIDSEEIFLAMYPSLANWTVHGDVGTDFKVPIVFFEGHHDWQAPITLSRAYFAQICAPWKSWVEFPHSAHVLVLEEPGRVIAELVAKILPATRGERPAGAQACPRAAR